MLMFVIIIIIIIIVVGSGVARRRRQRRTPFHIELHATDVRTHARDVDGAREVVAEVVASVEFEDRRRCDSQFV